LVDDVLEGGDEAAISHSAKEMHHHVKAADDALEDYRAAVVNNPEFVQVFVPLGTGLTARVEQVEDTGQRMTPLVSQHRTGTPRRKGTTY
jgi:hypothetical protein